MDGEAGGSMAAQGLGSPELIKMNGRQDAEPRSFQSGRNRTPGMWTDLGAQAKQDGGDLPHIASLSNCDSASLFDRRRSIKNGGDSQGRRYRGQRVRLGERRFHRSTLELASIGMRRERRILKEWRRHASL